MNHTNNLDNTKNNEKLHQWHPAFCSAMKLEFKDSKHMLSYTSEYNINTKPIQIDLLVIKKRKDAIINNELGKLFLGHNLIEYKSPKDELNVDVLYQSLGYACLYKAHEQKDNKIALDDVTITLIRRAKPVKLLKMLVASLHFKVTNPYRGIYYINKEGFFPIQLVVAKELDKASHIWLTSLTDDMSKEDAIRLLQETDVLLEKDDRDFADSVLQLSVNLNKEAFGLVKEEMNMCEALRELMRPEIDEEIRIATDRVTKEVTEKVTNEVTRKNRIRIFRNMINRGYSRDEAQIIAELTDEQIEEAMSLIG